MCIFFSAEHGINFLQLLKSKQSTQKTKTISFEQCNILRLNPGKDPNIENAGSRAESAHTEYGNTDPQPWRKTKQISSEPEIIG